ncbi:Gfo/Idh/MocA family oxidoreductase [Halobacteria archaeon AArc-m2/3/4]|uniref:Gfo/Idh/MocA family oxidoreductase n=1 Tax=Natronoglomus mannanivorans TaxID=2979990 RepID=A0ABT2QK92_9EURY|nr:Gfo/Idh/MocA family oxidoreductase [Halobacteria archaeon AArc-m2/3/4]
MLSERPINVGVIGVGTMGIHHARVYNSLPSVNLVGVHDVYGERAEQVARSYDSEAMSLEALLSRVDAVSIAVPTKFHYDTAISCLDAGVATLIEKPMVADLDAGRRLFSKAKQAGVPVQVGHVERFNPAVSALKDLIAEQHVFDITCLRLGPSPGTRITDNAVFDLMIHDIDVVLSLANSMPTSVKGTGVANNEHVSALLKFESGMMASLTASHVTQRKIRTLRVTTEACLIDLDYFNQTINIYRRSDPEYLDDNGGLKYRHEGVVEQLSIPKEEPLQLELESFIRAAAADETPQVTVEDGLNAIKVAHRIDREGMTEQTMLGA